MKCTKFKIMLSGYVDNGLSPCRMAEVAQHLEQCGHCRREVESLNRLKWTCREMKPPMPTQEIWGNFTDRLFSRMPTGPVRERSIFRVAAYVASVVLSIGLALGLFLVELRTPFSSSRGKSYRLDIIPSLHSREVPGTVDHKPVKVSPNIRNQSIGYIKGISQARLSTGEMDFLTQNGFVITSRKFPSFAALYKDNQKNNLPSFVTMDMAISGLSHILARLRVDLEREVFLNKIKTFTGILREQLLILHPQIPDECKEASFRALAFVKVAGILLECEGNWPSEIEERIKGVVDKEMALIYNGRHHKEFAIQESPIFGYSIDYNKFKIRWDETNEENLRAYYQAMEWYSRCVFRSSSVSETQTALLVLLASIADAGDGIGIWDEINQMLTALYGEADDLHLQDYQKAARDFYGDSISPSLLTDKKKVLQFCRQVERMKLPRIRSEVGLKGGLRIFGGRYYDRDMILQQMCYPYVGENYDPRVVPSVLDIAVIMNQTKAIELAEEKDFFRFSNYRAKVESYKNILQQEINRTSTPWTVGGLVGDTWTYKPLMQPEWRGYPYFCRSDAWESRKLTSILCGLIHLSDSRPVFTGKSNDSFNGVVDPYPEFFNRMLTIIRNLERLLYLVGYPLNRQPGQEILLYKRTLEGVVQSATKIVAGENLQAEDHEKLGRLALGWESEYQEANINELSTLFHRNATQVDFYFHAGIEPIREMWVAFPSGPESSVMTRGGVYMLYEFFSTKKVFPEEWRKSELWKNVRDTRGLEEVAPWLKSYDKH